MKFSITKMLPFALLLPATMAGNSATHGLRGIFDFLSTQSDSDNSGICKTVMDQFKLGTFDSENIEMVSKMNEKFQLYCSDPSSAANKICAEASTLIESGEENWGSLQQIKALSFSVSSFCEPDFLAEHKGLSDFVSMAKTLTTQDICETVMDEFMLGTFDPANIKKVSNMNEKFQLYCSDPSLAANKICAEASTLIESGEDYWGSLQQIKALSFSVSSFCENDFLVKHKGLSDFVSMADMLTMQDNALDHLALLASELFTVDTTTDVKGMVAGLVGGMV